MVAEDLKWGYFNYPSVEGGTDDSNANNIANQVFAITNILRNLKKLRNLSHTSQQVKFDKKMTEEALCIPTDKANADAWPAELTEVKPGFEATTGFYDWAVGAENKC